MVAWNLAGLPAALKPEKAEVLRRVVEAERPDVLCISEHMLCLKLVLADAKDALVVGGALSTPTTSE